MERTNDHLAGMAGHRPRRRLWVPDGDRRWLSHLHAVRGGVGHLDSADLPRDVQQLVTAGDVVHIADDSLRGSGQRLEDVVVAAWSVGARLVVTLRHLHDPGAVDRVSWERHVEPVVGAADHVVTYTIGGAAELASRFGREVTVIPEQAAFVDPPHPDPRRGRALTVGIDLEDLPPSIPTIEVLTAALDALTMEDRLWVRVCGSVLRWDHRRHDAAAIDWISRRAASGVLSLFVGCHGSNVPWLAGLDALVLAHGWGTHSPWIDAARTADVPVISLDIGYLAQQGPCMLIDDPSIAEAGLREVFDGVRARGRSTDVEGVGVRAHRAAAIHLAHERLYSAPR